MQRFLKINYQKYTRGSDIKNIWIYLHFDEGTH